MNGRPLFSLKSWTTKDFFVLNGKPTPSYWRIGDHEGYFMIKFSDLTLRKRRVLMHLLEGIGEKEVAGRLGISARTVHAHLREVYRSFDVHSLTELMRRYLDEHDRERNKWAHGRRSHPTRAALEDGMERVA